MTIFERRQRIISLIHQQPGIRAVDLATLLDVSEGTIRNDLRLLDQKGQLARVRGGAVPTNDYQIRNPSFAATARLNSTAKQKIARWAADLVEDGDAILLDASTTVFNMVPYLNERQNLTIVTNGIETALALTGHRSNTVILIGGVLRQDGVSVVGHLGEKTLESLNIRTAFVSSSGFSLERGLTDVDLQDTSVRKKMVEMAKQVVALIDSSKFGRVDLVPFIEADQVSQIFTDNKIDPLFVEQMRTTSVRFSVCGDNTILPVTPLSKESKNYRIGFANLSEQIPFAVDVRSGLERAARAARNIELIVADNQLSSAVAVEVADRLCAKNLDLMIEYQIDYQMGSSVMRKFRQHNIPVIAVDIPMIGATFFGADNYQAGFLAGEALGRWIKDHWQGELDHLIVLEELRTGPLASARVEGQLTGVESVIGKIDRHRLISLDSGNTTTQSRQKVFNALKEIPNSRRVAVICINDDASLGALLAAREMGREQDLAIVGQGADRKLREEIRRPGSRVIGSTAFWPEKYGEHLLEIAFKILRGEAVPPAVHVDHVFINAENIDRFYPGD